MKRFNSLTRVLFFFLLFIVSSSMVAMEPGFTAVDINRTITSVQPMTGLVLWRGHDQMDKYTSAITLEFAY